MKAFVVFIFLFHFVEICFSQDIIILKDYKDTINCKILIDSVQFLEYKLNNSSDTNSYRISSSEYEYYVFNQNNTLQKFKNLKKGAYLSFNDFINNSPAFDFSFEVIKRTKTDIALYGGNDYKINSLTDNVTRSDIKKIWGICDGKNCYINCQYISPYRFFSIITFEKDYAYFSALPFGKDANFGLYSQGAVIGAISGADAALARKLYKINFTDGSIKPYNK